MAARDSAFPGVQWIDAEGVLRLGIIAPDERGIDLVVLRVGKQGFAGRWKEDLGLAAYSPQQGGWAKGSEGFFCAWRRE